MNISKELLSKVLNVELEPRRNELNPIPIGREGRSEVIFYWIKGETHFHNGSSINIYELAYKCKEWASSYGYDLFSHRFDEHASYAYLDLDIKNVVPSNNKYTFIGNYIQEFEADTEPEAIFKACEYILNEMK